MAEAPRRREDQTVLVLAGPSGVGKSTVIKNLLTKYPDKFGLSVSHTTRGIRPSEKDGVNYHYVSVEEFQKAVDNNEFIEHAIYASNHYGTSFKAVEDVRSSGKICILDIDMQGVLLVKKSMLNDYAAYIMILPPSFEELERRLRSRGDTSEAAIEERLETAKKELQYSTAKDFWDTTVVNDQVEATNKTVEEFLNV